MIMSVRIAGNRAHTSNGPSEYKAGTSTFRRQISVLNEMHPVVLR